MSDKESIISSLKESKRFEKKDKLIEALTCLDKVNIFNDPKPLDYHLSLRVTKQISTLCNRLVLSSTAKVPYLRRAEQTLQNWASISSSFKMPLNEKIFRITLLTYNNWATYYQSTKNYHNTLNYLMKALKFIEENQIKEADSFQYIAKTQLSISALYSELRQYSDAIHYAEEALSTLQTEMKLRISKTSFAQLQGKEKKKAVDMFGTYVIAFYNIGVAQGYLDNKQGMAEAFKNAVGIGKEFLPEDNEFLETATLALAETQIKKKKMSQRSSIRISPELLLSKSEDKKTGFFNQNERKSIPKEENKISRYYSEAKLKKIQEKMKNSKHLNFVSVDQYFYREISKLMNVNTEVKHLKPLTTEMARELWEQQDEEKVKICTLREKKSKIQVFHSEISQDIQDKIQKLKEQDEGELKKQEIKIKSKAKTKVFKNLMNSINKKKKKFTSPPQRLSFKPPLSHFRRSSSEVFRNSPLLIETKEKEKELRLLAVQSTKDEIERMMEKITNEIKNINIEKGITKPPSPDLFATARSQKYNTLADSVLKKTEKKPNLNVNIFGKFFGKKQISKTMSPRTVPKQILINYQV